MDRLAPEITGEYIETLCPCCSNAHARRIQERIFRSKLIWSESINYDMCGEHLESDGIGLPPVEFRKIIIDLNGEWQLHIDEKISISITLKIIRNAISLDINDTKNP